MRRTKRAKMTMPMATLIDPETPKAIAPGIGAMKLCPDAASANVAAANNAV
jgi:hypothetical protein